MKCVNSASNKQEKIFLYILKIDIDTIFEMNQSYLQ